MSATRLKNKTSIPVFPALTFPGLFGRAADKLDAGEDVDAAGEEHREAAKSHRPIGASPSRRPVPLVKVPALGLVVYVVKETVLRHQEGVRLERSLCGESVSGSLLLVTDQSYLYLVPQKSFAF